MCIILQQTARHSSVDGPISYSMSNKFSHRQRSSRVDVEGVIQDYLMNNMNHSQYWKCFRDLKFKYLLPVTIWHIECNTLSHLGSAHIEIDRTIHLERININITLTSNQ